MKTSTPRLRSVRFKDGRAELRVLRSATGSDAGKERLATLSDRALEQIGDRVLAGYAMVMWSPDGTCWIFRRSTNANSIPPIAIPDMIRNAMLADTVEDWAVETIKRSRIWT